jgi:hypothetical protein
MKKILFLFSILHSSLSLAIDCPPNKYPVKAHTRTDYYRNDGTYVSATNVSESCREYGSLKPLKLHFEDKMPKGWPHKNEKFKAWNNKEKSDITAALDQLPAILTQIGELKIYRAIKSEIVDNPATSAPDSKIITIYDDISKHELKRVLAHELAHIYYAFMSKDEADAYHAIAQWKYDKENAKYVNERTSFTAEDGKLSPDEDFSNNIEFYYFEKKKLEKEQDIFKWIQKMTGEK